LAFVFQDYHLFPRLTTAENVAIPLILKQRDWDESITEARKYLEIVGLKGRGEILPVKLSGGEQQRVAIARAIISQSGDPDSRRADRLPGRRHREDDHRLRQGENPQRKALHPDRHP
jgi:predicted ABC-type transport system involved in lysophospholipase L1 biosynthesis ATPase subunit